MCHWINELAGKRKVSTECNANAERNQKNKIKNNEKESQVERKANTRIYDNHRHFATCNCEQSKHNVGWNTVFEINKWRNTNGKATIGAGRSPEFLKKTALKHTKQHRERYNAWKHYEDEWSKHLTACPSSLLLSWLWP